MERYRKIDQVSTTRPRCLICANKILDGKDVLEVKRFNYVVYERRSNTTDNKLIGWIHLSCIVQSTFSVKES